MQGFLRHGGRQFRPVAREIPQTARRVDVRRAFRSHDPNVLEIPVEVEGTRESPERIVAGDALGSGAQCQGTGHRSHRSQVGAGIVKLVARIGRASHCGVGPVHPWSLGKDRGHLDRRSHCRTRRHGERLETVSETQPGHHRAVARRGVLQLPGEVLRLAVQPAAVADDAALDRTDTGRLDEFLPVGEGLLQGKGHAVARTDGGVSPADDV